MMAMMERQSLACFQTSLASFHKSRSCVGPLNVTACRYGFTTGAVSSWGLFRLGSTRYHSNAALNSGNVGRRRASVNKTFESGLRMAAIDYKALDKRLDEMKTNIQNRKVDADADKVMALYHAFCSYTTEAGNMRQRRNENAAKMKSAGKMGPEERGALIEEGKQIKADLAALEHKLAEIELSMETEAMRIPNFTHPDVPVGEEANATLVFMQGEQRAFGFEVRDHVRLGEALDLFDFDNASRVTGPKFYYLRNAGALLEFALINYALSRVLKHKFTPMTTPDLAHEAVVAGCGFNPRGESSQVYTLNGSDLCLVGTAEIPLGGYYSDQLLDAAQLPIRMAAVSHCFRQEAGSAGLATRGLYRVHQFTKVEMFVLCHPDDSDRMHDELLEIEKGLFSDLGLHYKVLDMPTEDLGNPAYRKFDIEAWMPGRGSYGEISSASNCTDYQARRLNIKYRHAQGDNRYVHTLNGTACAVPRMIVAILENFQTNDGKIIVPEVLRPFMGGMEIIE
ncbi:Serine--tRNA ligase, chloroplastic/mitochondrial [Porphyridium purpureum]|uniref:serine--tRNA ligase n=1 Tax=Porphyridium purpureum TaxID=35688 RepID=A0A5J4Z7A7_PORPP|nr:Serine--tRNA ligase, chloroplastic/mitochondrial [Porphyridium purpureum]|eukprot:POR4515..scf295_1